MMRLLLVAILCLPAAWAAEEAKEPAQPPVEYKWINFALLAGGLGYLFVSKGFPALNQRGREIEDALQAAEKIKREAAAEEAAIARKMSGLKAEIDALRTTARSEMEAERVRLSAETQSLVAKLQANAEGEIGTMTKQAQNALRTQASELALSLARQKVAARINAATDATLISGFVSDLKNLQEARN